MLVVCCGMLRSGSTLQYHLATSLVEASGVGEGIGWVEHGDCRELDQPGRFRVVKVHNAEQLDGIEEALREGRALYIYSYRDIRDVIVSIQHKWKLSFRQVLQACYIDFILQSYTNWMALPGGHVAKYEEFVHAPADEALAIAGHLGISLPADKIVAIAAQHTLDATKSRISSLRVAGQDTTEDGILHSNHVFSGASGQWRGALKPYQIGLLEQKARHWLAQHGYEPSQSCFWRYVGLVYFWCCLKVLKGRNDAPPKLF
ncbi:MAG: hypothetical protein HN341_11230 [Verrucomicrobia bacterium]|jgi:hypothetical protein|nr:hypothetical protein [Verrucomicrobiota bacterium]